jgi:hypothetical protein
MANDYKQVIQKLEKHISLIQEKLNTIHSELIELKKLSEEFSL